MGMVDDIIRIRGKIQDDKSKDIFEARVQYMFDHDSYKYFEAIKEETYILDEFDEFIKNKTDRKILIYGAGRDGMYTCEVLRLCGYKIDAFCDSNRDLYGQERMDIPIISLRELFEKRTEYAVVIATRIYVSEIYQKLLEQGFDRDSLFYPMKRFVIARSGRQYFDFFTPNKDEVFVDAGAFDGMTTVEFVRWTDNNYEKVYLFEANNENENMCREVLQNNHVRNYDLIMKGTWDKEDTLEFDDSCGAGSGILKDGGTCVKMTSIDSALAGRKATFIKMDVERCEYESILGAEETIKKYKPRLAISVYHKQDDFLVLPQLLLAINPEYHFAYRHYTSYVWETVLYAW